MALPGRSLLDDGVFGTTRDGVAFTREFGQMTPRLKADKGLQDLVVRRGVAHDGNPLLRQHVDNADIKKTDKDHVRIIKLAPSLKVDACVALSMSADRTLFYNPV